MTTGLRLGERGARLSGGRRQRLGIARALYHESMSALDHETGAAVIETVEALHGSRTIIRIVRPLTTILLTPLERGRAVGLLGLMLVNVGTIPAGISFGCLSP